MNTVPDLETCHDEEQIAGWRAMIPSPKLEFLTSNGILDQIFNSITAEDYEVRSALSELLTNTLGRPVEPLTLRTSRSTMIIFLTVVEEIRDTVKGYFKIRI